MAFKHRQVNPQTNDIIDAEDINENNREFVNELNGFLDRDNIPFESIGPYRLENKAINSIFVDREIDSGILNHVETVTPTQKTCVITSDLTGWQNKSSLSNNLMLNVIQFEADTDGVIICEWSGNFVFGKSQTQQSSDGVNTDEPQVVEFRILMNGIEIAKLTRIPDSPTVNCGTMYGVIPVPAGDIKIMVEARTYLVKSNRIKTAADNSSLETSHVFVGTRELICNFRKR
tara:strand:- start:2341 stop:3033 length:693 start_codon:yes stop_codon:yes gene_type:complete